MKQFLVLLAVLAFFPSISYARTTPNDIYQQRRESFEEKLEEISDSAKKEQMRLADKVLNQINQAICDRFEQDIAKLAAILSEIRSREGMAGAPTVVAFGQGKNQIEVADYWVNYAQEAVAYQRIADYTPQFSGDSNLSLSVSSSMNNLQGDLTILQGKILRAKTEVKKVLQK